MSGQDSNPAADCPTPRRFLPWLLVLFVGSGCAALIYEIVWFQLLQLVIGSSAVSLAVLLGTFMGGMCLGSLALPRVVSARRHPLRVYAVLGTGNRDLGIVVLFGMPYVVASTSRGAGHGLPGILCADGAAVCLLPPTLLMGATLPAIARWVETTPQGVSWLGFFYGGNIAGAVFGCLLAGFYLLRVHDMATATYVAAAINGAVALISLGLAAMTPYRAADRRPGARRRSARAGRLAGVRRDRAFGAVRAGRRGDLDAPVVADAGRDGLHVLDHPGRVPDRDWESAAASGSWLARGVAATADRAGRCASCCWPRRSPGPRTCSPALSPIGRINPSLSTSPWFDVPARSGALSLGHPARRRACGARVSRWRWRRRPRRGQDPGRLVRAGLCRQHGRRDPRRDRVQPAADPRDRHRSSPSGC